MPRDLVLLVADRVDHRARAEDAVVLFEQSHELHAVLGQLGVDVARGGRRRSSDAQATERGGSTCAEQAPAIGRFHVFDVSCFAVCRLTA